MTQKAIEIKLRGGLEARPVAVLVQVASKYDSTIYIEVEGKKINAKSIMGMMTMALKAGEKMTVEAKGVDEEAAIEDRLATMAEYGPEMEMEAEYYEDYEEEPHAEVIEQIKSKL